MVIVFPFGYLSSLNNDLTVPTDILHVSSLLNCAVNPMTSHGIVNANPSTIQKGYKNLDCSDKLEKFPFGFHNWICCEILLVP